MNEEVIISKMDNLVERVDKIETKVDKVEVNVEKVEDKVDNTNIIVSSLCAKMDLTIQSNNNLAKTFQWFIGLAVTIILFCIGIYFK